MSFRFQSIKPHLGKKTVIFTITGLTILAIAIGGAHLVTRAASIRNELQKAEMELGYMAAELEAFKAEDQYVRNEQLQAEIESIKNTYQKAVSIYEEILESQDQKQDTTEMEKAFAQALTILSNQDYSGAETKLTQIEENLNEIAKAEEEKAKKEAEELAAKQEQVAQQTQNQTAQAVVNNQPPAGGYSRQAVQTDIGTYTVDVIAGDLGTTRVIVDTASASDCRDNCPVLSLGDYVARNGAYAGVNGSYFCPASYPSCAGKTNSFDTLLMNKNKTYFNSDNNVYSNVPAVIFGGGYVRFVGASSQWGRDTSIDSMIANQPLLVSGGNNIFAGDADPKKGSKAGRSFVASKGNTVYIGVVRNSSVAEAAKVLSTMGMDNALNLDSGGSTALWYGGYKAGPGRNIPNAILFVSK